MIGIVYDLELVFDIVAHPHGFHLCRVPFNAVPNIARPSRCQGLLLITAVVALAFSLALFDRIHHHGHDQLVFVVAILLFKIGVWV